MKRVIAVNWRWKGIDNQFTQIKVENDADSIVLCSNFEKPDIKSYVEGINTIIKNYSNAKILVLSHKTETSNNISRVDMLKSLVESENLIVNDFTGYGNTDQAIYFNKNSKPNTGFLLSNLLEFNAFFCEYTKGIPLIFFNHVWKYYWLEKLLEEEKKKLIDTFQPLFLDIVGLSEVKGSEVEHQYKSEITESVKVQLPIYKDYINQYEKLTELIDASLEEKLKEFGDIAISISKGKIKGEYLDRDHNNYFPKVFREIIQIIEASK